MGNVVGIEGRFALRGMHQENLEKAIKKIEDIETYNVDAQLNKVTVTGNVTTEQLVRVLQKIGKMATTWEEEGQGEGEGVNS
ncbi:unnamed protein product [Prunus armeniaca]|uniref:HMA domain-containing protein n=1 Tax=Prunus armeniaca TaxID=36596 RepID=A0A6J5U446_PRUAR|nr:unnamed protein product [Prunus armeniaca]